MLFKERYISSSQPKWLCALFGESATLSGCQHEERQIVWHFVHDDVSETNDNQRHG
jgi:hypothetical protein